MFVPLHVKSDFSLGYGTASVEELVEAAAALGYRALALTDLENLYAQVRFHHVCRAAGIRPITGMELRAGFDGRRNLGSEAGRLVLLALDESGYRSLCRIVSRRRGAVDDKESPEPRHPVSLAARHPEGIFALSDDVTVLEKLLSSGSFSAQRLGLLVTRPVGRPSPLPLSQGARGASDGGGEAERVAAARRLGVRIAADLDCVLLEPKDHALHQLQVAIRQGKRVLDVANGSDVACEERWLRPPAEAAQLFDDLPGAVEATAEIAELCRLDLTRPRGSSPLAAELGAESAAQKLRRICQESLSRKSLSRAENDYRTRLQHELQVIDDLGFSDFMLVVADILEHCKSEGIPVAARGSAVSSLVLHLIGGSPVDPLANGLLFERFLHAGKSAWPDVDLDLPWERRDEVIDWVYGRYGEECVAMVAAYHTFRYRSALREGLKAWGARPSLIDALSAALPPDDLAVEEVDFLGLAEPRPEENEAPVPEHLDAPGLRQILPLARRLVGRPHHIAAHPGGIVVDRRPLQDLLPLEVAPKGVVIAQYDLVTIAQLGLVKIDLLGNRCLSELNEALTLAGHQRPVLSTVPTDNPETLDLIDRADTIGCFQLESPAMRSLLERLPIRSHADIVAALALIRPGAAAGEVKSSFVRRARGEEEAQLPFPAMEDRLHGTFGLFLYEEDVMLLLSRSAGVSLEEADELRRAIVKSGGERGLLHRLETRFVAGARERMGEAAVAQAREAWHTAERFAAYSFNKAHAASYALLAYYSAYVKAHYPAPFACALLNHHQGLYPLRVEAAALARMGVELRAPHVNASAFSSRCECDASAQQVRVGLDKVKGLTVRRAREIVAQREAAGPFLSLRDFLERVAIGGRELAAVILAGACDGLRPLAREDYPFVHEAALKKLEDGCFLAELNDLRVVPQASNAADRERTRLYQRLVRARNELLYLEMHLSGHPMTFLRSEARRYGCIAVDEVRQAAAGDVVRVAVVVAAMRRMPGGQGIMQFLTLEDETGLVEAVLLPPVYQRLGDRVATPGPFLVEGRVRRQQEAMHLEVHRLDPFKERLAPFGL